MMEGEMKRFALRQLSTAMNEGDQQIARLGVVLKMLALTVEQIEHKLVANKAGWHEFDLRRRGSTSLSQDGSNALPPGLRSRRGSTEDAGGIGLGADAAGINGHVGGHALVNGFTNGSSTHDLLQDLMNKF